MDYEKILNELFEYCRRQKARWGEHIEREVAYADVMLKIWDLVDAEKERTKDGD